eukprot:TRINITY_DN13455_c0_g1_i2.p1 TRINITY_DN13455_c0_g1~~TRINITY_DN13455_c0_g1_i2.p1  ORF type:complete len:410 (+),score=57.71 TRINITY_DN13455_c0_g1_i2:161-1390(+)
MSRTEDTHHQRPAGHPEASMIRDRLYLGGTFDARDAAFVRQKRITHILNVSNESYPRPCAGVLVQQIRVDDTIGDRLADHFPQCSDLIHRALSDPLSSVLVHCEFGISRSATIVAAYLMDLERLGPATAVKSVRERRHLAMVCPNPAFLRALMRWGVGTGHMETMQDVLKATEEQQAGLKRQSSATQEAVLRVEVDGCMDQPEGELPDPILKHKNDIAEHILTLHCPECDMAFLDFTNCFALWCSLCDCAFCAYCQTSCRSQRNDAHYHVSRCPFNIAPRKSIFADFRVFEEAQNLRRVRELSKYLDELEDLKLRTEVIYAIQRDCEDLGMKIELTKLGGAGVGAAGECDARAGSEAEQAEAPAEGRTEASAVHADLGEQVDVEVPRDQIVGLGNCVGSTDKHRDETSG